MKKRARILCRAIKREVLHGSQDTVPFMTLRFLETNEENVLNCLVQLVFVFKKNKKYIFLKLIFLVFLDHFDVLISKKKFKIKYILF